jgi:FSR family fosmidomycin resistance protein-like MFS transporter
MNKKRLYAAVYGHASIDLVNASVAMVLVLVSARFDLSISQIGLGALVYQICAAMSQPLFGGLADRLRGRWVGALGLLWTLAFYSLASFMPSYALFIGALMIGGLGSGAFHAAGLLNASVSGGAQKAATATSLFFVGGQVGFAIGPIVAGLLLQRFDMAAMPFMALAMLPAVAVMLIYMNDPLPAAPKRVARDDGQARRHGAAALIVVAFFMLITFRSGTSQTFSTLLPKYYDTLGYDPSQYGFMLGLFAFAGAFGTFLGGYLGDRVNRRMLIFTVTMLCTPFAYLMLHSAGWVFVVSAITAGALIAIPHSIILVMAQELAPNRRGLVGGLVLGFVFASGSTVAWLASVAADYAGLERMLSVVAFMPILAGLCALLLPSTRRAAPVQQPAASQPAAAD